MCNVICDERITHIAFYNTYIISTRVVVDKVIIIIIYICSNVNVYEERIVCATNIIHLTDGPL